LELSPPVSTGSPTEPYFAPARAQHADRRGFRGTYNSVSLHHALRAWHIVSGFGNRRELGKIKAPEMKSK